MRTYRLMLCVILAGIMVLALCACGKAEGEDTAESTAPAAQTGDGASTAVSILPGSYEGRSDLVVLDWEALKNRPQGIQPGTVLNYAGYNIEDQFPWDCYRTGWFTDNIYEGLLYMYMNDPEDIRGCIAERWEHSDDYLTWTFYIRDGVKFHDGTVCDAYAVAKSWDYTFAEAYPPNPPANDTCIASWEAVSAKEFVVRLEAPCPYFEIAAAGVYTPIGGPLLIVSPTALDFYGADNNQAAVGTGPYYVDTYLRSRSFVLKANPDYYLPERMPSIETVNIVLFNKYEDTFESILNGGIDAAEQFFGLKKYYDLEASGYDGRILACPRDMSALWFNAGLVEEFRTYEVRKAMCRFVDLPAINERVFGGLGRIPDSIWARGTPGYVPTDQYYYDPEEGLQLLASVGLAPSDISFRFTYLVDDWATIEAVLAYWDDAGVQMDLTAHRSVDSTIPKMEDNGLFYVGSAFGYTNATPNVLWAYGFKPTFFVKLIWQNIYDPALFGKMLEEYAAMTAAKTWDEMLTSCNNLTAAVQDDFSAIPMVQTPDLIAVGKDIKSAVYFSENHWPQFYYFYKEVI